MQSQLHQQLVGTTSTQQTIILNPQNRSSGIKKAQKNPSVKTKSIQRNKCKSIQKDSSKQAIKNNIEDQMEKYFKQYAVMEYNQKSPTFHKDVALGKKQIINTKNIHQEQSNINQQNTCKHYEPQNKLYVELNNRQVCQQFSQKSLRISTEDADQIIKRFKYHQNKRRQQIERLKQQKQKQEMRQMQSKPLINSKSRYLVKNQQPISQRYQRIIKQKQKKLQQQRIKYKKQKQEQENQFIKQLQQKVKQQQKMRTTDQFFQETVRWKQKKNEKNKQKQQLNDKQLLVGVTFKPYMNQKSKRIMQKKTKRQSIFDQQPKVRQIVQQYTFMPKINKKVPKFI